MNTVIRFQKGGNEPFPAKTLPLQRSSALTAVSLVRGHLTSWNGTVCGGRFSSLERSFR